jgi:hypothetical protein
MINEQPSGEGKSKRKTNGYCSTTLHARRDKRRREADFRQGSYDGLTLKEKFDTLDPKGSKRQRARLEKQLAEAARRGIPAESPKPVKKKK